MLVVATALCSALAYAVAMVLQQRSAQRTDHATSLHLRLIGQLVSQGMWLVGIAANGVAFGLRALALSHGSLVLVQPLLLTGLFFALLIETRLDGTSLSTKATGASAALIGGLSLFALSAAPTDGTTSPSVLGWFAMAVVLGPCVWATLRQAGRSRGRARAPWLALAAGLLLAAMAALMKKSTAAFEDQGFGVLSTWSPYALLVVGGLALLVTQSAFQAAPLRVSLPVLSVTEPVASILIGAAVFHEQLATSPGALLGQLLGLGLLLPGVVALTSRRGTPAGASYQPATTLV